MVVKAEVIYDGGTYNLSKDNQSGLYFAEVEAIKSALRTDQKISYYPVMVRITDDAGNVTIKTVSDAILGKDLLLMVREIDLFPMKFIIADECGKEIGFINSVNCMDFDFGDTNDFEIEFDTSDWNEEWCNFRYRLYIPGTEYGGLIEIRKTSTSDNIISWGGNTWRGLLDKKIIEPPDGQDHLIVSGEANKIMAGICGDRYGSLIVVDSIDSNIQIESYAFDRYTTILRGFEKMLATQDARLKIYYQQGVGNEFGAVHISAVRVVDWSDDLEFSQDGRLQFTTDDYRCGINHLICAGSGEGAGRIVLHLFVQRDGSIGEHKYYTGIDERTELYSYSAMNDLNQLRTDGIARLKELMNYKKINVNVENVDVDIGDIVGGRDYITGMEAKLPVLGKIIRMNDDEMTIEYIIEGDE